jgi:Protein of unknown function (DUF1570)
LATSSLAATASWLLATLFLQIPPPVVGFAKSAELRERREQVLATERSKLQALADRLRAEGKKPEAEQALSNLAEATPADGSSRFLLLSELVEAKPKGLASVEVGKKTWQSDRETIRLEAARALFDLAGRAARGPETMFAFADECLRAVIARQPDHSEARRLLGFLPHQGGWATPFAARMLAEGSVYDKTYGWVKADWVPHLRRGELPDRGLTRWLPAAEADALRRDWATRWEISTEHFRISTNVPLNEAISFGRKLEDLHQLFFSLMADVIDPALLPMAQRFKKPDQKPTVSSSKKPYQVYYFATRAEYAEYLRPYQGEGSKTSLGTYIPRKEDKSKQFGGISYFFNDVGGELDVTSTLYHEASHQLLFESAGPDDYVRNVGNYWVFEGLGTYFETLQHEPDGSLRIGGLVGPRIAQAQTRLLHNHEFVPIGELVSMNVARFQGATGSRVIYLHYAESMALAVFLMQAGEGRYREGFLDYVRDAYKGRFRGGSGRSLEDRVGVRYPELDRAFLDYLARGEKP